MDSQYLYILHRRRGLKNLHLTVKADGSVLVSAPQWMPKKMIDLFVASKRDWLKNIITKQQADDSRFILQGAKAEYQTHKEAALRLVLDRLLYFAPLIGVTYHRVLIRNTVGRWGSC